MKVRRRVGRVIISRESSFLVGHPVSVGYRYHQGLYCKHWVGRSWNQRTPLMRYYDLVRTKCANFTYVHCLLMTSPATFELASLLKMNNKQSTTTLPTLTPLTPTTRCFHDHAKQHFPSFLLACQSLQTYLMPRWIQQKRLNWSITSIRRPTTYQTTTIFFIA